MRRSSLLLGLALAGGALIPAAALGAPANFRTPSGNIGCDMRPDGVRCDVLNHTYTPPKRPRSCQLDWGTAVFVGKRGRARFVCVGDTVVPSGRRSVVPYGTTIYRNDFRCTVRKVGVTCVRKGGRGFFVSRERYRLL